ncbi:flagellar biosynthetic protein FliQ [Breoghania corrubedonensis]|uniref:Flagellar biosynthetic protein FliQ n=1 Tax=Breoghania corrubedonensis TaxID=665038 RepID=A0A2T5VDF4_9HYPH|nr:flagellar biosynthesis protein FliQ [Breoghania corrubedonensis]PTW61764.1 flagellar biosynthetic protein FliQ [Breoghania corrubedonensis]
MNGPEVLDIGREGFFVLIKMLTPVMVVGLGVGLIVALFQALTQIQEMTLVFVPKILAIFITLMLVLPFMGQALATYMNQIMALVIQGQG